MDVVLTNQKDGEATQLLHGNLPITAALLLLFSALLGSTYAFLSEKSGGFVTVSTCILPFLQ